MPASQAHEQGIAVSEHAGDVRIDERNRSEGQTPVLLDRRRCADQGSQYKTEKTDPIHFRAPNAVESQWQRSVVKSKHPSIRRKSSYGIHPKVSCMSAACHNANVRSTPKSGHVRRN